MNNKELLHEGLKKLGICVNEEIIDSFFKYLALIKMWNEKINLTAINDEREIILKHFIDSLSVLSFYNFDDKTIVDIGTGAGLPGIPIKIICGCRVDLTLVDSSQKKINAVKDICNGLGFSNVKFISSNVELLGNDSGFRNKYDYALIRAVGSISTIIEYSIPLLKNKGRAFLYKGPHVEKEVENSKKALEELNAEIIKTHEFIIPFSDYQRNIVVVEKNGETNEKYPRRVGLPKNRPL